MPATCCTLARLLPVCQVLHSAAACERVQGSGAGNRLMVQEYGRGAQGRSRVLICQSAEAPEDRLLDLRSMEQQLYAQLSTAIIGPLVRRPTQLASPHAAGHSSGCRLGCCRCCCHRCC